MIFTARMCGSYSPTTVAGSYNIVHTFLSFDKCSMIIGLEKSAEYYFITLEANDLARVARSMVSANQR